MIIKYNLRELRYLFICNINQQEEESQECGTENQIPQDELKQNSSYEGKSIVMLLFSC